MNDFGLLVGDLVFWRKETSYAWNKNPWLPARVVGHTKHRVRIEIEGREGSVVCVPENLKRQTTSDE
jgi:hypothetical protein